MVLALANHFFAKAEGLGFRSTAVLNPAEGQRKQEKGKQQQKEEQEQEEGWKGLWMVGSAKAQCQALVCALLFALHPVHVEVGGSGGGG